MILGLTTGPGQKVYRLRPGSRTDTYGDEIADDWSNPVPQLISRATVQPVSSSETETPTADQIENERNLFVPGSPDLVSTDRVRIGDEVWRIVGDPFVRRGLASGTYTAARLRRVVG